MKLTNSQKDLLVDILNERRIDTLNLWVSIAALTRAGFIVFSVSENVLTEKGRQVALARKAEQAENRSKQNAAAKVRNATRRSLGLTRTRNGGWE